ncbi:MAG: alpha/beta hydrolase family protein [Candidatus Hermodarchaeota archaeon]
MENTTKKEKYQPTIKDMLFLPLVGGARTSPDGTKVAYLMGYLNLKKNNFEVYCYIYNVQSNQIYQLTQTGRASTIQWVNDNTLALRKLTDNGFQIFLFEELIGEGFQVTNHPGGVESFRHFANGFVFLANKPEKINKNRQAKFGSLIHVEEEESSSALYYIDIERVREARVSRDYTSNAVKPVVELSKLLKQPLKIESFVVSPNFDAIFLNCRRKDDLIYETDTYCFRIQLDARLIFENSNEENLASVAKLTEIALPKGARVQAISPDGSKIIISYKERGLKQYFQSDLWILDLVKNEAQLNDANLHEQFSCITQNLDQEPIEVIWTKSGMYIRYWNESTAILARITESGDIEDIDLQGLIPESNFSVNDAGHLSFHGSSATTVADVYLGVANSNGWDIKRITKNNEIVDNWDLGTVESIRWTSKDGTEIEGVLHKPSNFDPSKKYPLLFQVHGGPAASSPMCLLEYGTLFTYPTVQLLNKGILILRPNYRGSLGRGQAFLELNVDNLGVGDMWDLESAIDYLVDLGFVDETKIGSMGWSQGGYISSFVSMHSTRFKAVSAGAALSSWRTYFNGSDCRHAFNISGTPYEKEELYEKTAPMSAISKAQTPIMFQHGENDQRVPLISAMEMYRALKAKGIQTELFVYPGKPHGFLSPKENFAMMVQNYRWFAHFLLGEELNLFMDDERVTI